MNHVQANKITQIIAAQSVTGGATVSASIDTSGYDYATFIVNVAASTTPSMTALPIVSLLSCDTTVVTDHATVVADQGLIASSSRQYVYHIDKRAKKRYFRLTVTRVAAGTDGSGPVAAACILSKAKLAPASTSDMIGSTNDVVTIG